MYLAVEVNGLLPARLCTTSCSVGVLAPVAVTQVNIYPCEQTNRYLRYNLYSKQDEHHEVSTQTLPRERTLSLRELSKPCTSNGVSARTNPAKREKALGREAIASSFLAIKSRAGSLSIPLLPTQLFMHLQDAFSLLLHRCSPVLEASTHLSASMAHAAFTRAAWPLSPA